jgi:F-type H+-transporting ATPase subunit b
MLIDWFTVCAQVVNFAVLVWLMKRLLYGPIHDAIAAREKRIADELAGADRQRADADVASAALATRGATFDRERDALMAAARAGAQAEGARLVETARAAADALTAQRKERLAVESDELVGALRRRTLEGVFTIARKTLGDLTSTSLEASACDTFIGRVRALEAVPQAVFAEALATAGGIAVVRSAFDLPEAQRTPIRAAVDQAFGIASTLTFETASALVCGIELTAGGQKISWSIADELSELERGVASLLDAKPAALAAAG